MMVPPRGHLENYINSPPDPLEKIWTNYRDFQVITGSAGSFAPVFSLLLLGKSSTTM